MKSLKSTCAILFAIIAAAMVTACSKKDDVSFNTLEDARAIARDNALFNAAAYRAENPRLDGTQIISHGDSTQSSDCPQGDGWATVKFMSVEGTGKNKQIEKYTAKCSTVSASLGCYMDFDFDKKPFAKQENRCDTTLPFPLKKIAK